MHDYSKLKGRIVEKFGTQEAFSKMMNLSERSVSLKLQGKVGWKQVEISKAIDILDLCDADIPEYFFCCKSSMS